MNSISKNSNLEILKIIAEFIIVMHHFSQVCINDFSGQIMDRVYFFVTGHWGNIGNLIFITISAYFLVDSKKVKYNKIIYLLLFEIFAGFTALLINIIIGLSINKTDIVYAFTPFLYYREGGNFWYVSAYIIYYFIHGLLNKSIEFLSKKEHLIFILFMLPIYMLFPMALHKTPPVSGVTGFILIHFVVSFIKKYIDKDMIKKYALNFSILMFILYLLSIVFSYESSHLFGISYFKSTSNVHTSLFYNIFLVSAIVSLVFYIDGFTTNIRFINTWGSLSLIIFLLHMQRYVPEVIRNKAWEYFQLKFTYNFSRLMLLLYAIIIYIIYTLISLLVNKTLSKPLHIASKAIEKRLDNFIDKLIDRV